MLKQSLYVILTTAASLVNAATLAEWDSFNSLHSDIGNLTIEPTQFSPSGVTQSNGTLVLDKATGRAWIDISSLNMTLSTGSYSFVMDVENLMLGNGPIFSMTSGAYNTQTTGFGSASVGSAWAFSNNGGSMNVKDSSASFSTPYSGTLTVNFLTQNGTNYVEAFLDNTTLVSKTAITYSSTSVPASNPLTGLTLGGWGSTPNNGAGFTLKSLTISNLAPEPTSVTLCMLGGLAAMLRRRRSA